MAEPVTAAANVALADDPRFRSLVSPEARLRRLFGGLSWAEGPVWFAEHGMLVCSDIPNDRMLRWIEGVGVSVFRASANFPNGNTRDRQGRLVTCEHGRRCVSRTEPDGRVVVLADAYQGRRLNSPNDAVVASDGAIWFTDPPYGILSDYEGHRAEPELDGCHVFRLDPATGELRIVADDFVKPNGLAFSPDERTLYVADSAASHDPAAPHHVRAVELIDGVRLGRSRVLADIEPGVPDGLRVDLQGHVWISAADGVHCYAPDGTRLGRIRVPETVANLTFGGARRNQLLITATTSVYAIGLGCRGAQVP